MQNHKHITSLPHYKYYILSDWNAPLNNRRSSLSPNHWIHENDLHQRSYHSRISILSTNMEQPVISDPGNLLRGVEKPKSKKDMYLGNF